MTRNPCLAPLGALCIALAPAGAGALDFIVHPMSADNLTAHSLERLNDDARPDIVAIREFREIVWYDLVGPGPFDVEERILYTRQSAIYHVTSFDFADMDGDGDVDLIGGYRSVSSPTVTVAFWSASDGAPTPTFGPEQVITGHGGPSDVWAFDVDHDGDTDVITRSGTSSGFVRWWENRNGLATLWRANFLIQNADGGADDFQRFDWDSDGDDDLLYSRRTGDDVVWLEYIGGEELYAPPETIIDGVQFESFSGPFHIADLDGDGDADLIAERFSGDNAWWERTAQGMIERPFSVQRRQGMVVTDVNQDGRPDVLGTQSSTSGGLPIGMFWLDNRQHATDWVDRRATDDTWMAFGAADFDGDGDEDIAAKKGSAGDTLAWIENRVPASIALDGDLNNDCLVNFEDLNAVIGLFGESWIGIVADADGDNVVGFSDLNIVIVQFGLSCEDAP